MGRAVVVVRPCTPRLSYLAEREAQSALAPWAIPRSIARRILLGLIHISNSAGQQSAVVYTDEGGYGALLQLRVAGRRPNSAAPLDC